MGCCGSTKPTQSISTNQQNLVQFTAVLTSYANQDQSQKNVDTTSNNLKNNSYQPTKNEDKNYNAEMKENSQKIKKEKSFEHTNPQDYQKPQPYVPTKGEHSIAQQESIKICCEDQLKKLIEQQIIKQCPPEFEKKLAERAKR